MKVERETAGFALPFAAGVLLAVYSGYWIRTSIFDALAVFSAAALSLAFLMHPLRKKYSPGLQWVLVGLAALTAGMVCGITAAHISVGAVSSRVEIWAEGWGLKMQEAIDRIPFSDNRCNAVAKALVTGERSDIPRDIVLAFRESGASHILALSGLHLGIIYGILRFVLGFMGNTPAARTIRSMIMIICCGAYTIGTGCGPSIARAFLFILIGETAALTGRRTSLSGILMTALIVQTLVHPSVINEIGFQLSYAAVAGIAFIYPKLRDLWPRAGRNEGMISRGTKWIWNSAAMSVACQITTGPIAYAYFGTFPEYFILTNLIALPLTGLLIPAALLTLAASELGICPDMMSRVTELLATVLSDSLGVISTM